MTEDERFALSETDLGRRVLATDQRGKCHRGILLAVGGKDLLVQLNRSDKTEWFSYEDVSFSDMYPEKNYTATKPTLTTKPKGGYKLDENKLRMDLIPPEVPLALAAVLTVGAEKYHDRNWEEGMDWSRPYGALMRHLTAWWGGEDNDPETGMSHLWHTLCCVSFLAAYEIRGAGRDNRPKAPAQDQWENTLRGVEGKMIEALDRLADQD